MKCLLARDGTTPSDEKWTIKMEASKSFSVHVFPISKTESVIKIYRQTSQLWMRKNKNTTNPEDNIEIDCVRGIPEIAGDRWSAKSAVMMQSCCL